MGTWTKTFSQLSRNDAPIAGGKGASLGEMTNAGIPVPPGYVVLSGAFEEFLTLTKLHTQIDAILSTVNHEAVHTVDAASEQIKELILSQKMPLSIQKEIVSEFSKLGAKFVAVRSSATAEDGATHAWAGQLESYLNTTSDLLLENVKRCWASLFTPRAIFYRFEKKLDATKISVAVVIQKMIQSTVSGIAFSVHPVTQDYNQLIIEAGFGLGEAIVSGQITPDSYVVEKDSRKVVEKTIAVQERGLFKLAAGGNDWQQIPNSQREKQKLTDDQINSLAQIVVGIEKHYGFPCDIEWAFEGGKFYIVQSRPITTLNSQNNITTNLDFLNKESYISTYWCAGVSVIFTDLIKSMHTNEITIVKCIGGEYEQRYPQSVFNSMQKKGIAFYSNDKQYGNWKKISLKLFNDAKKEYELIKNTKYIYNDKTKEILTLLKKVMFEYGRLDLEYTDTAYTLIHANSSLAKNLADAQKLKDPLRERMEYLFIGKDSLLGLLLSKLSAKFDVPISDLENYYAEEILELFKQNKVNKLKIANRKIGVIFETKDYKVTRHEGIDALNKNKILFDTSQQNAELKGICVQQGKVCGHVKIILKTYDGNTKQLSEMMTSMKQDEILVCEATTPDLLPAIKKAAAIITEVGGRMSHAAITSRELKIPCVVGVRFATKILSDGDLIEVDATNGVVKILSTQNKPNEIVLSKIYSREKPLVYFNMWDESDRLGYKRFLNHDVQNNLFLFEGPDKKTSVWYSSDEFKKIEQITIEKTKGATSYVPALCNDLDKYWSLLKPYAMGQKKLSTIKDFKLFYKYLVEWWAALNTATIVPNLTEIDKKFRARVLAHRTESEKYTEKLSEMLGLFFAKLRPEYASIVKVLTYSEICEFAQMQIPAEKYKEIKKRLNGCFILNGQVFLSKDLNLKLNEQKLSLENETKNILVNLQSREHSLTYCHVWQMANQTQTRGMFKPVEQILFVNEGMHKKTKVWYAKDELQAIFDGAGTKAVKDPAWFVKTCADFVSLTDELIPYCEGKTKIKTLSQWKWFYEKWIEWWASMAIIFVLPESKTANDTIREKALKLRAWSEKYSDDGDRVVIQFLKEKYPKLSDIVEVMTPAEIMRIESLSVDEISNIRNRAAGYVFYNGKLFEKNQLEKILQENNLEFEAVKASESNQVNGTCASPGIVQGTVVLVKGKKDLARVKADSILVTEMTSPDYVQYMKIARAVVTDEGGVNCHAAIVSREIKKPCIVGTKIATQVLHDGDLVEVDANNGIVRIIR